MSEIKQIKVLLLGNTQVGKTSYLNRLLNIKFTDKYIPTMGFNINILKCKINENKIKFDFVEISGNPDYIGIKDGHLIGVNSVIYIVDNNISSIKNIKTELEEIRNKCGNIPIVIVVNKCEMPETSNICEKIAELNLDLPIIKCSCKNKINIKVPLNLIYEKIY